MNRLIIADVKSASIDGKSIGHYFAVADNYIAMYEDCSEVYVAGGPIYQKRFGKQHLNLGNDSLDSNSVIRNKINVFQNLKQLFERCKADTIVLQCSAVATAYLGIAMFKQPQTKLYVIQYNTKGLDSVLKKILYRGAKYKINGIICPDNSIGKVYDRPFCVVPDYIYAKKLVTQVIPYDDKKYDFGMIGIISYDKGVLDVAQRLKNTSYKLLIAGYPQNAEIGDRLRAICSNADNIELKLKYLSDAEYQRCIAESRYCILNYSGAYSEHSSGVVFDIIFRGTPVIGSHCRSLLFIKEYGLGEIMENISEFDFKGILSKVRYSRYIENIQKYYKIHEGYRKKLKVFLGI